MRYLTFLLIYFTMVYSAHTAENKTQKAIFAGGCFWCIEAAFDGVFGVESVVPGYTGGSKADPTYEEVSGGLSGHREALEIVFDPSRISYSELLDIFWGQIDPTDAGGQFSDRGSQYTTAIFYHDDLQRVEAEGSKARLQSCGVYDKIIVTQVLKAVRFYPAEEYHKKYYLKNEPQYKAYKELSGRGPYLRKIKACPLKIPAGEEKKKKLSQMQFNVTQKNGTEPAFNNEYWDNKKDGIYVDLISGEPLFCSNDKFDSGTGWPSFTKPINKESIVERQDKSLFAARTEVRSSQADSHLGHVFGDGPKPGGMRYCINSASLRFIPKEDLEKEGYGEYKKLFNY